MIAVLVFSTFAFPASASNSNVAQPYASNCITSCSVSATQGTSGLTIKVTASTSSSMNSISAHVYVYQKNGASWKLYSDLGSYSSSNTTSFSRSGIYCAVTSGYTYYVYASFYAANSSTSGSRTSSTGYYYF